MVAEGDKTFKMRNESLGHDDKHLKQDIDKTSPDSPTTTKSPSSSPTSLPSPSPTLSPTPSPSRAPSCRRVCFNHSHPNILIWRELSQAAGLLDRFFVLDTLLQMAGYLCARVYVPRPRFLLTPWHNQRQPLDPGMTWFDFVLYHWEGQADDEAYGPPLVDWYDATNPYDAPHVFTIHEQYPNYPYYLTDEQTKAPLYFEKLEQYVWNVQQPLFHQESSENYNHTSATVNPSQTLPFVWEITAEFYAWQGLLQSSFEAKKEREEASFVNGSTTTSTIRQNWTSLPRYCRYVQQSSPDHMVAIRNQVIAHIKSTSSSAATTTESTGNPSLPTNSKLLLGDLHIRRTDATHECDTSLPRLQLYLNCSLWDAWTALALHSAFSNQTAPQWHIKLLFSSDERNTTYRHEVGRIVQDLAGQVNAAAAAAATANAMAVPNTHKLPLQQRLHVTLVDMDALVDELVDEHIRNGRIPAWRRNNFYLFQVIMEAKLIMPIKFRLEQRRSFQCPDCTNVQKQLIDEDVRIR